MSEPESDLTPEQEAQVGRLLAQARHDEPLPDAVAARLDGVLAELGGEGSGSRDEAAPVADLAAHRRRRRAGGLLLAAAAVIVAGVGLGQVISSDSDGDDASSGAADAMSEAPERDEDEQAGGAAADEEETAPEAAPGPREVERLAKRGPVEVGADTFADDAVRYQDISRTSLNYQADSNLAQRRRAGDVCRPADFGPGVLLPASYDGTPAVLAYRAPTGESQVVDLLQCGSGEVLRTITLPVP